MIHESELLLKKVSWAGALYLILYREEKYLEREALLIAIPLRMPGPLKNRLRLGSSFAVVQHPYKLS